MRLKTTAVLGLVAAGSLLLAACGSSSSSTSSSTSAAAPAASGSSSAAGSAAAGTTGKIGVILPDTKSSARWETQDRPNLEAAFKKAGVAYDIQNANGDKAAMATIADGMIANGATVLAIVNLDSESGAAIEKKAKAQGVQTIDYDRLTLGGSADYYVSFNNTTVGELQGKGLAECLGCRRQEHRLRQRLAVGQQRHAVLAGCALGPRPDDELQGRCRAGDPELGQPGRRHHLRADVHRRRRQDRRCAGRQ